jgi:RNA polymerase sigma-70 factor (ECF subfamily)
MDGRAEIVPARVSGLSDEEIVARVRRGETALFEVIMRRYNQRLYRAARAILRDDGEAEDVMQEAYVRAFAHLRQFAGRAAFGTWLTRIAVHEALARARRRGLFQSPGREGVEGDDMTAFRSAVDVEKQVADRELGRMLESAVEGLPDPFRTVFVLREIEEMSTAETAAVLDIREETVKTRLHRARALLRRALYAGTREAAHEVFQFGFARCDRVVAAVLRRIGRGEGAASA